MTLLLATLKKRPYLLLTCILTLLFWALYTLFDSRQGGTHLTIFSTHLEPLQYFVTHFGVAYVALRMALDCLISLLSAILIAFTIDQYRSGKRFLTGSVCSTGATVVLGFAVFGCPSCVLPIAGTFGIIFTSEALPLFGFEFKILSLLITGGTLIWLLRRLKQSLPHSQLNGEGRGERSLSIQPPPI
jgi:Na+/H+-translocating membrane pyrophosphatase